MKTPQGYLLYRGMACWKRMLPWFFVTADCRACVERRPNCTPYIAGNFHRIVSRIIQGFFAGKEPQRGW